MPPLKPQQPNAKTKSKGTAPTQVFLPIAAIKDDTLILKNGGARAVLSVSSVNFYLKSEDEQNSIIYAYQGFLNILEFPIQILVRSKKLDVDHYIESFREMSKQHTTELMKNLTEEYMEYVKKLVEYADIMEKKFFVIIPYDPLRTRERNMLAVFLEAMGAKDTVGKIKQRFYEFDSLRRGLSERVDIVKTGLESCSLQASQLTTPQLIELFYQSFNPIISRNQKVENIEETRLLNI